MVDEQHAVEMVHLVLEADGEESLDLFLVGLALLVLPARADLVGEIGRASCRERV